MPERVPIATEPSSRGIQPSFSEPLGEIDSQPATGPVSRYTDGWGLAIETVLSPESAPLPFSSPPVSAWAEAAGQQKDVHLWRLLARACEEKGKYSEALVYATEAIRMQPDDVAALSLLAQLSEKQHADEAAAHWHRQVLVHDPARKTSNRFLAHYYYSRGTYKKAVPYFTQLLEAEPKSRLQTLYYLLARVKTSDICGVANLLAEVRGWQHVSSEERALAHELFFLIGSQCLKDYHVLLATRYLTWAEDLIPTPEGTVLLAKAVALGTAIMEAPETSAQISEPPALEEKHKTLYYNPEPHTFLQAMIATVGAAALTVALGLPLFFTRPPGLISQQESELVSSDEVPRLSDTMPEPGPTTQPREPSLSTDIASQQVATPTLPSKANPQTKDLIPVSHPVEEKPKPAPLSSFSIPKLTPKLKSMISESPQRPKVLRSEQKATPSGPVVTINTSAATANSAAPRRMHLEEEATEPLPSAEARQPNPKEEPEDVSAMTAVVQQEAENQESLRPTSEIAPESTESLSTLELAAVIPSPPMEQEMPRKMEAAIGTPLLSSSAEETRSAIPTLASQFPHATQFPTREREVALSPEQLWPKLKALVEQETEVLLREDKEQGILHGTIVQRQLRPRIHTFKPYGHYLVEVIPGATEGTSLVRAKILTFDWRTKRPSPGAEQLADRFLQKIVGIIK